MRTGQIRWRVRWRLRRLTDPVAGLIWESRFRFRRAVPRFEASRAGKFTLRLVVSRPLRAAAWLVGLACVAYGAGRNLGHVIGDWWWLPPAGLALIVVIRLTFSVSNTKASEYVEHTTKASLLTHYFLGWAPWAMFVGGCGLCGVGLCFVGLDRFATTQFAARLKDTVWPGERAVAARRREQFELATVNDRGYFKSPVYGLAPEPGYECWLDVAFGGELEQKWIQYVTMVAVAELAPGKRRVTVECRPSRPRLDDMTLEDCLSDLVRPKDHDNIFWEIRRGHTIDVHSMTDIERRLLKLYVATARDAESRSEIPRLRIDAPSRQFFLTRGGDDPYLLAERKESWDWSALVVIDWAKLIVRSQGVDPERVTLVKIANPESYFVSSAVKLSEEHPFAWQILVTRIMRRPTARSRS